MEDWIKEAIELWQEDEVKMNPPATAVDIEKAETTLNFNFPDDFKALYTVVNGFEDYEWQEYMFSFWSLDRIIEEFAKSSNKHVVGFCDFLIMSHVIGFKRNEPGVFKDYSVAPGEEFIAGTFKESISMINSGAPEIY
ncbi:SMI1/KNR4 family protein [Mucilaginibacter celer]|uniref:SMI1/KNR4 family protein n=1 Tax=Mucilaginibacter celer TaxID=2305508 RepID=A0A494VS68_9SPHI|nr:SMI1/KNR4 family protein [Mucilaginibacter celer]AYL94193.1 SMI1/KNR4 family protein [Mucilaginibacter celer]